MNVRTLRVHNLWPMPEVTVRAAVRGPPVDRITGEFAGNYRM
jgi:hypothetical protein